jgi:macrolide transport system ATP-binding/permease protein
MNRLIQVFKASIRQSRRSPWFAIAVALTLALSVGANTAVFSVVNALLLKVLPYPHPERLGTIFTQTIGTVASDARRTIDGEQWELLRDNVPSLVSSISAMRTAGLNLESPSHAQYIHVGRVSKGYFNVLGLHPIIGRNFSVDEDRPHGPTSIILSYALWRTAFEGKASALGQVVHLKGEPYTVIGVLPGGTTTPLNADAYIPLQPSRDGEGQGPNFIPIVRLRERANWQEANAEINRAWAKAHRTQDLMHGHGSGSVKYYCVPLQKAQTDALRPQVLTLMLAATFILLIACGNLAALTLVRMLRRKSEIAVRVALGASRWQIQQQLWAENLLLALLGGAIGVAMVFVALRGLLSLLPEHFLPVESVTLDARVLAFTLALSVLASILFGMLPALTTRNIDILPSITSRGVIGGASFRLRQGLVAGEVALTVVLLAAAGLLVRTLIYLETIPPGFKTAGVMVGKISLNDARYSNPADFRKLINESIARIREIPGVQNAAVGLTLPYERAPLGRITLSDGEGMDKEVMTNQLYVSPNYFATLQIPLVAGRSFTDADGPDAQPVVIVNLTFARKFFHDENPIGHHLSKSIWDPGSMLIVGVVGDTVLSSAGKLNTDVAPLTREEAIYIPAAQIRNGKILSVAHTFVQPSWIVRTAGSSTALRRQLQLALASIDPSIPFSGFYSMDDLMASALTTQRIEVSLLLTMASLALLLSTIGIFALVANSVAQRTREIGLRIALGSTILKAILHVGRAGAQASGLGLIVGIILCVGALRALRSVIYGVTVYDTPTIVFAVLILAVAAVAATIIPALRVGRIDPSTALREE